MDQKQKTPKQPQDPYAQHGKKLASTVQRLRGWVGSDPSRAPELADALVEVTAHRLLGHGFASAAADAQESVRRSAQLLTANGPIGPYTSVADAARYFAAVVQLATIQAAVGQPAAAGRTIESLQGLQQQLRELGLEQPLDPRTAIWAMSCTARSALAAADVAEANAYADAALARLPESGPTDDTDTAYLAMDVARLASDCRWAAGRVEESLAFLRLAQDRYEAVVGGRLHQPSRLSPALVERLAEPLFGLYRDMADRLAASGEADLGLVTRRALVELLRGLAPRLGPPARLQLASALADLARDLLATGRVDEAETAAAEAVDPAVDWSRAEPTRLVVQATHARVLTRSGRAGEAVTVLRHLLPAAAEESASATHAVILLALAEALRADGDTDAAVATEQAFDHLAADLVGPLGTRDAAGVALEDLARGVVSRGTTPVTWSPLSPSAAHPATPPTATGAVDAQGRGTAEPRRDPSSWLEAERAEAHRLELERLEQARLAAERREAERLESERAAAEQLAAERAQAQLARVLEAERRAAAEEAERVERKRRREERLEAHRLEVEQREAERRNAEQREAELDAEQREAELDAERREADRLAVDPAEAERLELQRLQAELDELDELEELERTERAAGAEGRDEERLAAAPAAPEPAAPVAADEPAAEDEEPLTEAERGPAAEPDPLAAAQQAWHDARAQGDRRSARAALEQVVELLRPRAQAKPVEYGTALRDALEALSSARLRSGDVWGSRAAAREAKALAKTLTG
jgi:hypothetical protein